MSEEQRRQLQQQLWKIADDLRGKMNADEFRDYTQQNHSDFTQPRTKP
jgi:type I restriction-modification system DNA methylase subunit